MSNVRKFREFREMANKTIIRDGDVNTKKFFALDSSVYKDGVLNTKTKEMIGLVASMVLRCDDCINYHIIRCKEEGTTKEEFYEIFNIALVVGGSIVIPHFRRAIMFLEELENQKSVQQ
jgi:AhpD family alkylhydroperoxidase